MINKPFNLAPISFFKIDKLRFFLYAFFVAFASQIIFWSQTENIKPNYEIIPIPPNQYFLSAASFGDNEFLFRTLAFRIQNSGDIFLKFTALKDYDYLRLYQWLTLLDSLNAKSNLMPSLASYYFSQTQKKEDSAYIVQYLSEHASKDLDANWWWIFQAITIAQKDLHNEDWALKLAYKLSENNAQNAPLWTKQMPAFIYAKQGNNCMAFTIIQKIIEDNNSGGRQISVEEMNFMRYFINDRLKTLKNQNFDPRKC
ncbi:MAG: hypothetical protein EXR06_02440 [Rickettsiales bacterium]|nr:hypothetical protein [Rickettsiales bacterium]